MKKVSATLEDGTVMIDDEGQASRLQNRGRYGVPQSGGKLRLHLIEAIYLMEKERLCITDTGEPSEPFDGTGVDGLSHGEILAHGVRNVPSMEVRYSVFRDLRERGYIIASPLLLKRSDGKHQDWDLEAYKRGTTPGGGTRPDMRVFCISERASTCLGDLVERTRDAATGGRQIFIAVVDEEGDITYYDIREMDLRGSVPPRPERGVPRLRGQLLEDRVVISEEDGRILHEEGHYGKLLAHRLHLSFLEAAYLAEMGTILLVDARTGRRNSLKTFLRKARERQPDFRRRLRVYRDLRERGMVVKTGFKYGTHFRVYDAHPDKTHAKYLVHALPEGHRSAWPELSRAVRLAHGVRKEMLFTRVLEGERGLQYVHLERVRP